MGGATRNCSDHLHGAPLLEMILKHLDMAAITNVSNHADDVVCKEPNEIVKNKLMQITLQIQKC